MIRGEVNERSAMWVFERSAHGGLGRGNVGAVVSRPGVGKTALLVQIGLDALLRERRVLPISHEHAVDRIRACYDEILNDLARSVVAYRHAERDRVHLRLLEDHERPGLAELHLHLDVRSMRSIDDEVPAASRAEPLVASPR